MVSLKEAGENYKAGKSWDPGWRAGSERGPGDVKGSPKATGPGLWGASHPKGRG